MRTFRKKNYPICSIILMISLFFQGCSVKEDTWNPMDSQKSEQREEELHEASITPYGKYPETITYTLAKMTADHDSNLPEGDTYENNAYTRLIKEVINVQNENVFESSADTYNSGIATMIATGKSADLMVVDQKTMNTMQKNGQLEDLTDVYETCASDRVKAIYESYGSDIFQSCTFDGKLMALPETNISDGPNLLWVRKDWLDQFNLELQKQ